MSNEQIARQLANQWNAGNRMHFVDPDRALSAQDFDDIWQMFNEMTERGNEWTSTAGGWVEHV